MGTTTDLINAIKRNTVYPSSSIKFNDPDFIAFLNEEMKTLVATEFMALKEDFFIDKETITLVASQDTYNVPEKATSWVIAEIFFRDANGIESRLARRTRKSELAGEGTSNAPSSIYLRDTKIHVFPDMGTAPTGSIVVYYQRILNDLVDVSVVGTVQSVVTTATDYLITVDNAPSNHANGVDVINPKNPFELIAKGKTASVAGNVVTVSIANFDRAPVAKDYVAETGKTPVPHIPEEWHALLSMAASVRVLAASGDQKNWQIAKNSRDEMIVELRRSARDRVLSSPKKIVSRNYTLNAQRYRSRYF